ncbi:MAG: NADH-quinone oxidoreductase subunit N [Elusimicrobiota bacterium]
MKQLILILPEIFLTIVALSLLLGEAFFPGKRRLWIHCGIFSLFVAGLHQLMFLFTGAVPLASVFGFEPSVVREAWVQYGLVFGMISIDSLAMFFKLCIIAAVIMVLWLSLEESELQDSTEMGTYTALLLFAVVGMMFLVGSVDFLMAVIALELLSISSFILTGFVLKRRSSSEGAIKFFLVGTLSTGILLYGISYFYGYFGTTSIDALMNLSASPYTRDLALSVIMVFLIAGFGFKLSMAPFHMWAPDAYEAAPTPITAFLSVAPKAAALGFLMRLFGNHAAIGLTPLLAALAAITMTVGNLGALHQTNLKRLLAYSSIAQVGYILVAMVAGGNLGNQAVMIYTFVYIFMNMGVFSILIMVSNRQQSHDIKAFTGLYHKSFGLSIALFIFMLSLTGIPPLSGFIGKFSIFAAVVKSPDLIWLGVVAVINSVISVYYYLKVVRTMFFGDPALSAEPFFSPALLCCLTISLVITLVAGIAPSPLLGWVRLVIGS